MIELHMDPTTGVNERAPLSFGGDVGALGGPGRGLAAAAGGAMPADWQRTGRNAPCPCGSGKKFKHCHGALV
jgi:preprotein translocase subunit SecA